MYSEKDRKHGYVNLHYDNGINMLTEFLLDWISRRTVDRRMIVFGVKTYREFGKEFAIMSGTEVSVKVSS